ncbi:hypothetical protein ACFY7C_02090 [Streptomyces sp. NPDC012769]|uniref:hypothetical protein n=1 Tax=Streptomyces sp. NPDC012769 TaxID=3364848 RepID=UPI003690CAA5
MTLTRLRPAMALSVAVAALCTGQATAAPTPTAMPVPKAFRNGAPAPVKDVLKSCEGADCTFRILQGPTEFLTAVTAVGSAVTNCSNADMTIERWVTLTSSTTDNIEGEISGSWTVEGVVDKTVWGEGQAQLSESASLQNTQSTTNTDTSTQTTTTENGHTHHTSPKDKGPNDEFSDKTSNQTQTQGQVANTAETQTNVTSTATGTVTAHDELHVGVRGAFNAAWRVTTGTSLTKAVEEKMVYHITLKPKDVLTLGAQNAMVSTQGTLHVNDSAGQATVEGITVHSPSTVNASSLIAQTYTDAGKCIGLRPAAHAADPQPGPRPTRGMSVGGRPVAGQLPGLYETEAPPPGTRPSSVQIIRPVSRKVIRM